MPCLGVILGRGCRARKKSRNIETKSEEKESKEPKQERI